MMGETKSTRQTYHHDNLKEALIETGIDYVNENGYNELSLRKLASMCGVSHAAVYKHFSNKEDLFAAMKEHVKEAFSNQLEIATRKEQMNEEQQEVIYELANAYIEFFIEHPKYFSFVYTVEDIEIDFDDPEISSNYRPFEIFRDIANQFLDLLKVEKDQRVQIIVGMWAVVHGITEIAIMPGTKYTGDWKKMTRAILESNFYIDGQDSLLK